MLPLLIVQYCILLRVVLKDLPEFFLTDFVRSACGVTTCLSMERRKEAAEVRFKFLCHCMDGYESELVLYTSFHPYLIA